MNLKKTEIKRITIDLEDADHVGVLGWLGEVIIRIISIGISHILVQLVGLLPPRRCDDIDENARVAILDQLDGREEEEVLINPS